MGRSAGWIRIGCLLLWAVPGNAKNVCEMLREKGILSVDEADICKKELPTGAANSPAGEASQHESSAGKKRSGVHAIHYTVGAGFSWASEEKAPVGYGDSSESSRFLLELGNRLQVRYTFTHDDVPGPSSSSAFRIRRFKFFLHGNAFYPWLKYKLQADWVGGREAPNSSQRPDLDDALVDAAYFPFAAVQVGQYKVPFNRSELTSSGALQFVDRAITNTRFSMGRDQGVTVHGVLGGAKNPWLEYAVAVFNGNGKNRAEVDDIDHMGAARIRWTPFGAMKYNESDVDHSPRPLVGIGGGYVFNVVHTSSTSVTPVTATFPDPGDPSRSVVTQIGNRTTLTRAEAEFHRATADVHWMWRGASFLVDYFFETRDDKTPALTVTENLFGQPPVTRSLRGGPRGTAQTLGWNVQGGYFVVPRTVELAARYAVVDPEGPSNRQEEYRGAIGWMVWQHALKIQADFGTIVSQVPGASDRRDVEARAQLQLIF